MYTKRSVDQSQTPNCHQSGKMSDEQQSEQQQQQQQDESSSSSSGEQTGRGAGGRGMEALKAHVMEHKVDTALWATRALTLFFCISYLIPIFG